WPTAILGDVASVRGGKRLPKGVRLSDEPTAHPYLRLVDMNSDGIDIAGVKFIDDVVFQRISRYTISRRDIYMSIAGTIGLVGRVPPALDGANLTENAAKISILDSETLDPEFLTFCLSAPSAQERMRALAGGTAQPKLALYKIETLEVPIP